MSDNTDALIKVPTYHPPRCGLPMAIKENRIGTATERATQRAARRTRNVREFHDGASVFGRGAILQIANQSLNVAVTVNDFEGLFDAGMQGKVEVTYEGLDCIDRTIYHL